MASLDLDPPPDFSEEIATLKDLMDSSEGSTHCPSQTQFIKKLDHIPDVSIPCVIARRKSMSYAYRALVG